MISQLMNYLADGKFKVRSKLQKFLQCGEDEFATMIANLEKTGVQFEQHLDQIRLVPQLPLLEISGISTALSPYQVHYFPVISSTNTYIKEEMAQLNKGDLCTAEYQYAGYGRRGRQWLSPFAGQIMFSFYWTLEPKKALDGLSLVIGLAIAKTINAKVKWPNDVLLNYRKLVGISVEIINRNNGLLNLVIGVGINAALPQNVEITQPYAQLSEIFPKVERQILMPLLVKNIYQALQHFEKNGLDEQFQQEWLVYDAFINRAVNVISEQETIVGLARGIDARGYLKLEIDGEMRFFNAGEVSLRLK